jgi:hypothetical protein
MEIELESYQQETHRLRAMLDETVKLTLHEFSLEMINY